MEAGDGKPKYRVIYLNEETGEWEIRICNDAKEVKSWQIGHPQGSELLRFAVHINGNNLYFETKEEAARVAKEHGAEFKLVAPKINLPQKALELAYRV